MKPKTTFKKTTKRMSDSYKPVRVKQAPPFEALLKLSLPKDGARLVRLENPSPPVPKVRACRRFTPRSQFALTDGTNFLWIDFNALRRLHGATRYREGNHVGGLL